MSENVCVAESPQRKRPVGGGSPRFRPNHDPAKDGANGQRRTGPRKLGSVDMQNILPLSEMLKASHPELHEQLMEVVRNPGRGAIAKVAAIRLAFEYSLSKPAEKHEHTAIVELNANTGAKQLLIDRVAGLTERGGSPGLLPEPGR